MGRGPGGTAGGDPSRGCVLLRATEKVRRFTVGGLAAIGSSRGRGLPGRVGSVSLEDEIRSRRRSGPMAVVEHFLLRSVRRELSRRDFSGNFAELKPRWDSGNRFVIAPGSWRGTHCGSI